MKYFISLPVAVLTGMHAAAAEMAARTPPTYTLPPLTFREYSNWPYYIGGAAIVFLVFYMAAKIRQTKSRERDDAMKNMVAKEYEDGPVV